MGEHLRLCDEGTLPKTCSGRPSTRAGQGWRPTDEPPSARFLPEDQTRRRASEGRTRAKTDEDPVPKAPRDEVARRKIPALGAGAEGQHEGDEHRVSEEHVGQLWSHRRVLAITHYCCNFTSIPTEYSENLAVERYYGEIRQAGR